MFTALRVGMCLICMSGSVGAQTADSTPAPHWINNHVNGFDYQPTPGAVIPLEVSAGVRPSRDRQEATDRVLEEIDRSLLRSEGLSEDRVPVFSRSR
ncbi:MAG TPA: hypothetical protein DDZ81_24505 [Acetobacteraceae bacterium]|jgi:hypothetical protein|nr:hypothetical protein [Acetobacteraceae bacterium]